MSKEYPANSAPRESSLTQILRVVKQTMDMIDSDEIEASEDHIGNVMQWEDNGKAFRGIGKTRKELPPGLYNILPTNTGIWFDKQNTSVNDLIKFPDSSVDEIMREIDVFWGARDKYKQFDVQYKRGILMHGPPGSGKSSIIKLLIRDVIRRDGVAVDFQDPHAFREGMNILRKIHTDKPVVCIMEDIESIIRNNSSTILNILDGATNYLDNIVFVATSNYPEMLEERIKDRPSRFDRVIEVGLPNEEMRRIYLSHLFKNAKVKITKKELEGWVADSENLTFPHLQELFLSVRLYGIDYNDALNRLKGMGKTINSTDHKKKSMLGGFDSMMKRYDTELY